RVVRRVAAVWRVGKHRARPEHMAMRIDGPRRQLEFRLAALGEEGRVHVHTLALAKAMCCDNPAASLTMSQYHPSPSLFGSRLGNRLSGRRQSLRACRTSAPGK